VTRAAARARTWDWLGEASEVSPSSTAPTACASTTRTVARRRMTQLDRSWDGPGGPPWSVATRAEPRARTCGCLVEASEVSPSSTARAARAGTPRTSGPHGSHLTMHVPIDPWGPALGPATRAAPRARARVCFCVAYYIVVCRRACQGSCYCCHGSPSGRRARRATQPVRWHAEDPRVCFTVPSGRATCGTHS
jgi:hypothetical protein